MEDYDSLENAFDALADLLKMADDIMKNPKDKKIPKDIQFKLFELEMRTKILHGITKQTMDQPEIDAERIKRMIFKPPKGLKSKDVHLIERAQQLKDDVELRKSLIEAELKKGKKPKKSTHKKARKKKFRGIGGSKKWKKI